MFTLENLTCWLGLIIAGTPVALLFLLGACGLIDRHLPEKTTSRLVNLGIVIGLLGSFAMLGMMALRGESYLTVNVGDWVVIPDYQFSFVLLFDFLSIPFVIMTFVLCGTIGAFAHRYLHREPGFHRFYFLFVMFVVGMVMSGLAGTIETLFTGWELVGLSSALLVAFFQERAMPVRNGLRIWAVYRVADVAFLAATIVLHHVRSHGHFEDLLPWPRGQAELAEYISSSTALVVGLLLLAAAAGKSGLVPFSGWLPRAMEGPTPSSAVFYGALSVHLGAYLLLRMGPILELSPWLGAAIVLVGLTTAVFAALTARAQTDIKSALAFASLTQVGIIVAEIGLGLRWFALAHLIGHACLRTLQFVRAPTLLQDYRAMENAIGNRLPRATSSPSPIRTWFYRFAMERAYLDAILTDYIAQPVLKMFRWCDAMERRWTDFLSGSVSRESDRLSPSAGSLEEIS